MVKNLHDNGPFDHRPSKNITFNINGTPQGYPAAKDFSSAADVQGRRALSVKANGSM